MEIRRIRKELQVLFGNMNTADYRGAELAINDFLDFIEEEKPTKDVLESLPANKIDIDAWVQTLWNAADLSLPRNKQERISFLLAILKKYRDDYMPIISVFHASGKGLTSHFREYVDAIAKPIYQYLDLTLQQQELETEPVSSMSVTAENVVMINGDNYGSISQTTNETIQLLSQLASEIQESSELDKDAKLEAVANIDTVKAQMSLPKPNFQIVKLAWSAVKLIAYAPNFLDTIDKISKLLPPHLR